MGQKIRRRRRARKRRSDPLFCYSDVAVGFSEDVNRSLRFLTQLRMWLPGTERGANAEKAWDSVAQWLADVAVQRSSFASATGAEHRALGWTPFLSCAQTLFFPTGSEQASFAVPQTQTDQPFSLWSGASFTI